MALLYEEIMKVPNLSGTWQNRNKDLYYKLGAPYGSYKGNLQQNLFLLDKIRKNNYYSKGLPGQEKQATSKSTDPRAGIADATLSKVGTSKSFQDVMPQNTWNQVFDEWTRNFVNEYVMPEWQEQAYKPEMENMTRALENLNKQIGLAGRSGTAQESLSRAADESVKQEQMLRQQYQSDIANLRGEIRDTWATPLYNSQMTQYANTPWRNLNLGEVSAGAGIDAEARIGELASQYGVSDTAKLSNLIGSLGSWDPSSVPETTRYDWSVPQGDVSLFNQYKFNQ